MKKHIYWGLDFDALMEKVERIYQESPDYRGIEEIKVKEDLVLWRVGKDTWNFYDHDPDLNLYCPCNYPSNKPTAIKTLNDLIQAYRGRYNQY